MPTKRSKPKATKRWSAKVMKTSDAMDIDAGTFKSKDPKRIARSLKKSVEASHRRKSGPYQSAVSMLTFYINRGGHNVTGAQKKTLQEAKVVLKHLFGREDDSQSKPKQAKAARAKPKRSKQS